MVTLPFISLPCCIIVNDGNYFILNTDDKNSLFAYQVILWMVFNFNVQCRSSMHKNLFFSKNVIQKIATHQY